jgi:ABC-type Fe3+/spermidine/putrescine transport system ATPase subunit
MVTISIRNLTKRFGTTTALDNVSLRINAGEIFFLLGPSGCGKTTLLRHIAGFYTPDHGQIFFENKDVTAMPPHRRNTAMMFQSYALWPHMTVARNVAFGLEERKMAPDKIEKEVFKALSTVRMEKFASRKINQLSGGQQQRVALARALVVRPQCLLLDEPLSNLDAKLRHEMRLEIRRICQQFKLTAIYVTHDQKEALSIADRLAVLEAGRITQVGSPQEVYRSPHTKGVADFIGETNFIDCKLASAGSQENHWIVETEHGQFRGRLADPSWVPREGQSATISIRPEAITLSTQNPLVNTLAGQIEESTYLGEVAQYALKTAPGPSIRISELNPHQLREPGETLLYAAAEPRDVVILRH